MKNSLTLTPALTLAQNKGKPFDYEKLRVYQTALEFIVLVDIVIKDLPKGRSYLSDQLQRAATSIVLNIAEGAGEYAQLEKSRFYRMAKRSATECASIFDICHKLKLLPEEHYHRSRDLLREIASMLTKMTQNIGQRQRQGQG